MVQKSKHSTWRNWSGESLIEGGAGAALLTQEDPRSGIDGHDEQAPHEDVSLALARVYLLGSVGSGRQK